MKDIKAIVYSSNTGYSAEYARLLGNKTGLPVYSLREAKEAEGKSIIYIGWLMAGIVNGYTNAQKHFDVKALIGVGMGETGTQLDSVRKNNKVPEQVPVFVLQGGFDINKLSGMYKFMMKMMVKKLKKDYADKKNLTEGEEAVVDMLYNGGNYVKEKHLDGVFEYLQLS